jgi:hypothetical protein
MGARRYPLVDGDPSDNWRLWLSSPSSQEMPELHLVPDKATTQRSPRRETIVFYIFA